MASNNPPIQITGTLPTLGSQLKVDWPFAIALLVCIAGIQLGLSALAVYADWWNRTYLLKERRLYTRLES
jgi:hypothetical protein